jgi:diguanylate cyclase (GGDEF)-like protein
MIEELAEVAEAIRFHHLYPDNLKNELADFFAWWFGLASCIHRLAPGTEPILAEDLLWRAYPGVCADCALSPCFCRPGPVRELMSRPPPGQGHRIDGLTLLNNQAAYVEDLESISGGKLLARAPIACVRADVDDFKSVNTQYGHNAGDAALQHIAAIIRKKARERDRVYRISGDEFGVLFTDYTEEEAAGCMKRVCRELQEVPARWVSPVGQVVEFTVSLSIGVAECRESVSIKAAFDAADQAAYASKDAGKARVTLASNVTSLPTKT